ncbi:MAG: sodium/proton-translocating pyrophosphatase, partial [Nitrosopumilus sp.]
MNIPEILPFVAALASFLVAGGLVVWIMKQSPGTKEMIDISNAVKEGAAAFLKREMRIIIPVAIALT